MAVPSGTFNSAGNVRASSSLAANTTSTGYTVDLSTKFEGHIQVSNTGGSSVAATNGCRVSCYRIVAGGTTADTVAATQYTIATVASTAAVQTIALPWGKWSVTVQNLDTTNAITVAISSATLDSVA